ncbi:MAG: hypothetical protein NZ455_01945 [Bacteroidia bacterium]|nr:hypothetical protein [Bacteroidia bacterium]
MRSTEAIAQPAARRPCPHEHSEPWARTRPKSRINFLYLYPDVRTQAVLSYGVLR